MLHMHYQPHITVDELENLELTEKTVTSDNKTAEYSIGQLFS